MYAYDVRSFMYCQILYNALLAYRKMSFRAHFISQELCMARSIYDTKWAQDIRKVASSIEHASHEIRLHLLPFLSLLTFALSYECQQPNAKSDAN